ncbi:YhgE/Pip family protein [Patulibacter defluvii]|uniref:YhgE/Pip family protein n=1 Tax=Patulibacter defluvii TaxID=3095358 RepID=UPI002A75A1AA|nr:YhgE/Pip family protein [Patulibacter sp. DM4]
MTALRLALLELRRFRSGLPRLALLAFALVPVLYGGVYLWSSWDPFGRLGDVPVAVVNEDRPVQVRDQTVDGGQRFVDQLRQKRAFDWRFTDAADAADGIREGRYLFSITVPRDFSRRLASPVGGQPRQAQLELRLDDANGFIVSRLASSAQQELQRQINTAAVTTYSEGVLGDVGTLRDQLVAAQRGLTEVRRGTTNVTAGATTLLRGLAPLGSGTAALAGAGHDLERGLARVARTADALGSAAAGAIGPLTASLADAAAAADATAGLATGPAARFAARTRAVDRALTRLARELPGRIADGVAFRDLRTAARELRSRAADADRVVRQVAATTGRLSRRARELRAGGTDTARRLRGAGGADDLARAARGASSGLDALQRAVGGALPGARQLVDATRSLDRGVAAIQQRVAASLRQIPSPDARERARTAKVLGSPVTIRTIEDHPAVLYGRGLAPFFFPIGLWVFSIFVFFLLRPLNPRLLLAGTPARTVALVGWLPAAAIGAVGALVLFLAVQLGLGLDAAKPFATIGVLVLTVATFAAIVQLLRAWLGAPGDLVALVLLMMQLGSAGGLYPLQTTDGIFQVLHPLMPMSYVVDALRVTISGGQAGHAVRAVVVLLGFAIAALALTALVARRRRVWTIDELKPAVEL